jgi:outer membrane cobalamin receptor
MEFGGYRLIRAPAGVLLLSTIHTVFAHEEHAPVLEELLVFGRSQLLLGSAMSASEGLVGYDDIQLPPLLRVGELSEALPGMVATQHSGTGKANQYYMRGFNLDHGTDFSAKLDGVPLNMRTHGHGQGYLDLNFMIPEMVATTAYRKGPYSAQVGDFSSAGSVNFSYYEALDESLIEYTIGEYGFHRGLLAGTNQFADGAITGAIDVTRYDGPWSMEEDLQQEKLFLGYAYTLGNIPAKFDLHGYFGEWNATDQIPLRAVKSGLIGRLDFLDPDLGGETRRISLSNSLDFGNASASVYLIDYDFTLFSNFTYVLDNPDAGDEFEQRDRRKIYGLNINGRKELFSDYAVAINWGGDARYDDIDEVGLHQTASRVRYNSVRDDSVNELSGSAFGELSWAVYERLRLTAGARADYYDWEVNASRLDNSGKGSEVLLSPKFTLAYRIRNDLEAYLNYGRGMHSNDVRGATIRIDPVSGNPVAQVDVLVPSQGSEIGFRFEPHARLNSSLVFYRLAIDSELVFVGDAGGTEANNGSKRQGVEATVFWQLTDWLAMDAEYSKTRAKYRGTLSDQDAIPGAIESSFSMGLNTAWNNGLSSSLQVRHLGESPLSVDNSVRADGSTIINLGLAYRQNNYAIRLDAFNLLDSDDVDISYYYQSRLATEAEAGMEDIHFHPLEPRSVRISLRYFF